MNSPSPSPAIQDPLDHLTRRIRWKRWLGALHRLAWIATAAFIVLFLADLGFGIGTLGLRIALAGMVGLTVAFISMAWLRAWRVGLDRVGLAHLLEKRFPDLAERLVTLVQMDSQNSSFTPLLENETERRLAAVVPEYACPMIRDYRCWGASLFVLGAAFGGLAFVSAFGSFTYRLVHAYSTPLVPFTIDVNHGSSHALRGTDVAIEATIHRHDEHAAAPTECVLVCEYEAGILARIPMAASAEKFIAVLENVRQPLRGRVEAGGLTSESFAIEVIDPPTLVAWPTMVVSSPSYLKSPPAVKVFDGVNDKNEVLHYSKMRIQFSLSHVPRNAKVQIARLLTPDKGKTPRSESPVAWRDGTAEGEIEVIAEQPGTFEATLALDLDHGLKTTIALGQWTVYEDHSPRFTQELRFKGSPAILRPEQEYQIAPNDSLRLQAAVADREGLGAISLEYRINEGPTESKLWHQGNHRKELSLDDWLPLPTSLKTKDRVQFRVRAHDNRRLQKSEIAPTIPAEDLSPQSVIAPAGDGEDAWITLRVDSTSEGLLPQQAKAQANDVIDLIGKIKKKVQAEADEMQQLQRAIHLQPALSPAQAKQAEKLHKLNQEIMDDLNRAGENVLTNPALAGLAGHFFDIVDNEMQKSADALARFREKDRPLPEGENELKIAQEALAQARKKLERLLDWNQRIAQDRLDQFQIEKLEKRQQELAQRLEKMRAEPLDPAELAKEIEAIRQEQAKLAADTAQLQEKSKLVQDSLAALESVRLEKLAQAAEKLAAEQKALRELDPEKMPAEIKAKLDDLIRRQADLAGRAQPYARKNQGPDVKPAADAVVALKRPKLDDAIEHQKEHEKRQRDWLVQLLPGGPVNLVREQVVKLAKVQQELRADLEKLGRDLPQLKEAMVAERVRELVKRQRDVHAAVAKLAFDRKDANLAGARQLAENTTKQAGDQLTAVDALAAFETMEKAHQHLQGLAAALPQTLPVDRKEIKDADLRAKIEQVEQFEKEQKQLREETERLLADWLKAASGGGSPLKEKLEKLAGDLMELSQKGKSPEAKAGAKESMQAAMDASKALEASQAMKAKGDAAEAKKMEDEAEKKLELAVKQLAKLVQEQAKMNMPKDGADKTAEALEQSADKMRQAEANLPKMPKDAQEAMQAAAKKLAEAAQQASKQAARNLPIPPARNPAARAPLKGGGPAPTLIRKEMPIDPSLGKAWGELPGELKTRMLQDFRARYGEDYAELIRQYFERLAETPTPARKD